MKKHAITTIIALMLVSIVGCNNSDISDLQKVIKNFEAKHTSNHSHLLLHIHATDRGLGRKILIQGVVPDQRTYDETINYFTKHVKFRELKYSNLEVNKNYYDQMLKEYKKLK